MDFDRFPGSGLASALKGGGRCPDGPRRPNTANRNPSPQWHPSPPTAPAPDGGPTPFLPGKPTPFSHHPLGAGYLRDPVAPGVAPPTPSRSPFTKDTRVFSFCWLSSKVRKFLSDPTPPLRGVCRHRGGDDAGRTNTADRTLAGGATSGSRLRIWVRSLLTGYFPAPEKPRTLRG